MLTNEELAELEKLKSKKRVNPKDIKNSIFGDICFPNNISNPRQMLWHIEKETLDIPICPVCETNPLAWNGDKKCYRSFCSKKCTAIGTVEKSKETNLAKYGVEHYSNTDEFKEKVTSTSMEKYGVKHYSKTDEFIERYTKTNIKKYGFSYPAQNPDIIEKIKSTNLERYGEVAYAKTDQFREDFQKYSLEKYGTEHPLQNKNIRRKIKDTNIKRYGVEYPLQSIEIKNKQVNTLKNNYYEPEILKMLNNPEWLEKEKETKTLYEIANNLGISVSNLGKYYKHYEIYFDKLNSNASYAEKDIVNFLKCTGITNIIKNSHNIIYPKEIDIFLPDYNLAIEYNGIYWHGESKGKDKYYHVNKTEDCENLGIQLFHINDVEWLNNVKKDIWKSIIISYIGLSEKIHSKDCVFSQVSTSDAYEFLNENHLEGFVDGDMNYGLYYGDELVQCIVISKGEQNREYELKRISTKKYFEVIDGIPKILSNVPISDGRMITYVNRRFSNGNLYRVAGMSCIGKTPPDYKHFNKNGVLFENYFRDFSEASTELENMKENGYDKIWDCGNLIFTYKF